MPDRCVCCGDYIPEGRQVCPICERKGKEMKTDDFTFKHDGMGNIRPHKIIKDMEKAMEMIQAERAIYQANPFVMR